MQIILCLSFLLKADKSKRKAIFISLSLLSTYHLLLYFSQATWDFTNLVVCQDSTVVWDSSGSTKSFFQQVDQESLAPAISLLIIYSKCPLITHLQASILVYLELKQTTWPSNWHERAISSYLCELNHRNRILLAKICSLWSNTDLIDTVISQSQPTTGYWVKGRCQSFENVSRESQWTAKSESLGGQ